MPRAPAVSAPARQLIKDAFEDLERTMTPTDIRDLQSIDLSQVRVAALNLENELAGRQALCNMRRLAPLFDGLGHYSKTIEVLCNGTPFLSWIWAPITLILKAASDLKSAFEKIMDGYHKIADALCRFEILKNVINEPHFAQTLAVFYAEILEFHKHAYKFVRRNNWKNLFYTSWGRFQRRFDNILENLDRHGKLIDQEAAAYDISAAARMRQEIRSWREESKNQVELEEKQQAVREYQSISSWLKVDESEQIRIFETISDEETKLSDTCSWVLNHEKIKFWLQKKEGLPVLWLQGNPGCGKSVIAAQLVEFLQTSTYGVIHHFCTYTYDSSTKYDGILKSILQQLMRRSSELVAHVYQECIVAKKPPTSGNLEKLIERLFTTLSDEPSQRSYIWIVIDGINECEVRTQNKLIRLMNRISSFSSSPHGAVCKVLITTRRTHMLSHYYKKDSAIYLSDETSPLQSAIRKYVSQRLRPLHDRLQQMELDSEEINDIEELISKKAGGMFLYARLVIDYITANIFHDGNELRSAIDQLPETLVEFYDKLLAQILARMSDQSQERVRCIFSWIAFAKRPLKKLEFLSAFSFTEGDPDLAKLVPRYIVEVTCSPLIEERRDTTLTFIHSSVKHFLQRKTGTIVLRREDSLREHAIASVSCLLSGLRVFGKQSPKQKDLLRLIKGLHGFHVYATEYWIDYILENSEMEGGLEGSQKLVDLANKLAQELDSMDIVPPIQPKEPSKSPNDRTSLIEKYGALKKHVEWALYARSQKHLESELLQKSPVNEQGASTTRMGLDGVSLTLDSYQKAVEILLGEDSFPGASAEELDLFKNQFRASAYTCRLRSCPRATIGFESNQLRREHEINHTGGFRCIFPSCPYPPFSSSKVQKKHESLVHGHPKIMIRKPIRSGGNQELYNKLRGDRKLNKANKHSARSPGVEKSLPERRRVGSGCVKCSASNVRCNNAQPSCATCKRLSYVCIYLDPCEQCASKCLYCDKKQPICGACSSSAIKCSYEYGVSKGFEDTIFTGVSTEGLLKDDSGGAEPLKSTLGSPSIGLGYLDILVNGITGGATIDTELYERVKAIFSSNANACWKLSEVVDNPTHGPGHTISYEDILSVLRSEQPDMAEQLHLLYPGGSESRKHAVNGSDDGVDCFGYYDDEDDIQTESESEDENMRANELGYCFCNKEDSGGVIFCSNSTCPRKWFHLHCVGLVVPPDHDNEWFCSEVCRA